MSNIARMLLVLAIIVVPVGMAETFTFSGDRLVVANLIGEVKVESGGSRFEVEVDLGGRDGDEIRIEESDGRQAELKLVFPRASTYIYPRLGPGSNSSFSMGNNNGNDWLSSLLGGLTGRDRIKVHLVFGIMYNIWKR